MSVARPRPDSTIQTIGTSTKITTRVGAIRQIVPTPKSVTDPLALSRMLGETQQAVADATSIARSRHDGGAVLFKDLTFTAGETKVLQHRLQRPYRGWRWERPRGLAGLAVILDEIANVPANQLDPLQIQIKSTNACTVDVVVWGG